MATANATVMFTDIRGFTARTSKGTRQGLEQLLKTHEELLLPVIRHYEGRVVKTIGDAFLVVFESPTNAVLCGVMIQRRLREFNASVEEDERIEVRVAINSGEVTLIGGDVFGEPVNIAARIEGITEPNEIYFTEATYLTMQKAEVPSSEIGLRRLKGIPQEIKVYRVIQDEDNQLYQAIVRQAEIADVEAEEVVGSLSVPQWPPWRGSLAGPRRRLLKRVLLVGLPVLVGAAVLAFFGWQRYERQTLRQDAEAALEAGDWTAAQRLAGELWSLDGDDQDAIRLLTQAIHGELGSIAEDPAALQETWRRRKLAWGNLPSQAEIERSVVLRTIRMRIDAGEVAAALEELHPLYERDRSDTDVQGALVGAARNILLRDGDLAFRDTQDVDAWLARFHGLSERYGSLPRFAEVRADAALTAGAKLLASNNNFWKDKGIELLRTFVRENPDDRERGFDASVRLVTARRWHADPRQLLPYLEEDPGRGTDERFREALLESLRHDYDLEGEEEMAVREMFSTYWAEAELDRLHRWIAEGSEEARLNAFLLLRDKGALREHEADEVHAWVLLQTRSGRDVEMKRALDHWEQVSEARAKAAVPGPLDEVGALNRGASDERWQAVVAARFFPQVEKVLRAAVVGSRYAGERKASRAVLERRGALTPALASASYLVDVVQLNREAPQHPWPGIAEAVDHFAEVDASDIPDPGAARTELAELSDLAAERIGALGRRAQAWRDLKTRVERAIANLDP